MAGFEFTPDQRAIYFTSLADNKKYSHLYSSGLHAFEGHDFLNTKGEFSNRIQTKYDKAFEILERGIIQERQNEAQYFENILNNNNLDPTIKNELSNKLSEIYLSSENFNYIAFINLINEILLGVKQYRTLLKYEQTRLKELDDTTKAMKEKLEGTLDKNGNIRTKDSLAQELRNEYLKKHQLQSFGSYYKKILPTVDNLIAGLINKAINKVINNNQLLEEIQTNYCNGIDINARRHDIITQIINNTFIAVTQSNTIETILARVLDPNNNKADTQKIMDEVVETTIKNLTKIEINNQNNTYGRATGPTIIDEDGKFTGAGLADAILKHRQLYIQEHTIFASALSNTNSPISKAIKNIENLESQLKKQKTEEEKKEKRKEISAAKTQLTNKCKEIIFNQMKDTPTQLKQQVLLDIKDQLTPKKISITGPSYSEIIDTVIQYVLSNLNNTYFTGPHNLKADSIVIQHEDIKINSERYPIWNTLDNDFNNVLANSADQFYNIFQSNLPKSGNATNLEQGRKAIEAAIIDKRENLEQAIKDQHLNEKEKIQAMEELATYMKNSIFVTETMKSFVNYQSEFGFISGSLGPNIEAQIANFNELFEQATGSPMSSNDIAWLEAAIVNCSPHALGASNQGPIEKYLSVLGGFAVFDEGSFEVSLIAKTADEFYQKNSPKILHLYKLNGLYFPGSYILSRIKDNLQNSLNELQVNSINMGDGARIRATASEECIPEGIHNITERWNETYNIASSKEYTSVEITFLSNLLNLVDQLFNASNILPT